MTKQLKTRIFLWVMALWPVFTAQAQNLKQVDARQQQDMVERISRTAASIRTMACSFTQVKSLQFLNEQMTSEGRMFYKASGGCLRWEYQKPYQYTFILHGDKAHVVSAKGRQTIDISQSRLFQGIARIMMSSVTGSGLATGGGFTCTMYSAGDEWQAVLTPRRKEMKKMFKDIRLRISASRQMVTQVEMTEQGGDVTVITLRDVKLNGHVDEKMFADR